MRGPARLHLESIAVHQLTRGVRASVSRTSVPLSSSAHAVAPAQHLATYQHPRSPPQMLTALKHSSTRLGVSLRVKWCQLVRSQHSPRCGERVCCVCGGGWGWRQRRRGGRLGRILSACGCCLLALGTALPPVCVYPFRICCTAYSQSTRQTRSNTVETRVLVAGCPRQTEQQRMLVCVCVFWITGTTWEQHYHKGKASTPFCCCC